MFDPNSVGRSVAPTNVPQPGTIQGLVDGKQPAANGLAANALPTMGNTQPNGMVGGLAASKFNQNNPAQYGIMGGVNLI